MSQRRSTIAALALFASVGCSGGLGSDERLISRVDYGEDWPFTVEEGVLSCNLSEVVFTAGGVSYGINGSAMGSGNYAEVEAIWRLAPLGAPAEPLTTVPEAERRQLFADIAACEDSATEDAIRRFPTDVVAQIDEEGRLADSCKESLRAEAALTEDELDQISIEGVLLNWPPMTPTRMSIGQIIQDGLTLCD